MSTLGNVFEKAACRYCSAEISVNSLGRHEAECATATPELREERKRSREAADRRRLGQGRTKGEIKQHTEECEFCHDQIGAGSIVRHRVKCANRTPKERDTAKQQRAYQMAQYRKQKKEANRERYQASMREPVHARKHPLDEPVVPDKRTTGTLGSNGKPLNKPMSISMLVDEDNLALALGRVVIQRLPELLPQLIPGLSIEAFATKAHRAGKVV